MTVPGRLLFVGGLLIATSLSAAQSAHAQQWLPWRGSSSLHGVDPAKDAMQTPPRVKPKPVEPVARTSTTRPRASVARAQPTRSVLVPALDNPAVSIEPLPAPDPAPMQAAGTVDEPRDAVASAQISACDEISRCDRLELLRSGVGVEGPKDEAVKQREVRETKRNVLQSVRSIW